MSKLNWIRIQLLLFALNGTKLSELFLMDENLMKKL